MSADAEKTAPTSPGEPTAQQVREFLTRYPNFLSEHPELLNTLTLPERDLGEGVVDFQHYLVSSLQDSSRTLQSRYDGLVDFCRDNMSSQAQVHLAVLRLIRTRSLEQLLEVVTLDLAQVFDVDVVRLAMESETLFETAYGETNYSGIVFVPPGTIDEALGENRNVLLVEDCAPHPPPGFHAIFADCDTMIASCALLRLQPETVGREVALAFGIRRAGHYHAGQGIELLHFLAQIVAHQLDSYLAELSL